MFLFLGNLDAKIDWGSVPEFIERMFRILKIKEPNDYFLATKETLLLVNLLKENLLFLEKRANKNK